MAIRNRRSGGLSTINIGAPTSGNLGGTTGSGGSTTPTIDTSVIESAKNYQQTPGVSNEVTNTEETTQEEEVVQQSPQEITEKQTEFDSQVAKLDEQIADRKNRLQLLEQRYDTALNSTDQANGSTLLLLQLSVQQAQLQVEGMERAKNELLEKEKEAEEKGFFDDLLEDSEKVLTAVLGGALIYEGLDEIFGWSEDDAVAEKIDAQQAIRDSTDAITDPVVSDKIIDASYRDLPRTTDLDNLASYRTQFGSLAGDFFNDPVMGETLQLAYEEAKKIDPNLSADQFLVEFADQNPTSPISQAIRYETSKIGQLNRSSNNLFEIDSNITKRGLDLARKFYQPEYDGGMGFTPQDFRTQDQQSIVERSMGLMNDPTRQLLKDSISRRVSNQGRLESDELRDITASALTSVDPSLQNQAYLRSGGLGRSILNTSNAMRDRLTKDEGALLGLMQDERNAVTQTNQVVNSNTFDPTRAFGLDGSNTAEASTYYGSNEGLNYDPTSSYFSSILGNNANIDTANKTNTSVSGGASTALDGLETLKDLQT